MHIEDANKWDNPLYVGGIISPYLSSDYAYSDEGTIWGIVVTSLAYAYEQLHLADTLNKVIG